MRQFKFLSKNINNYWISDGIIMFTIRYTIIHKLQCWEYTHTYFEADDTRMYLRIVQINYGIDFVEIIFETINTQTQITQMHVKEYGMEEYINLLGPEFFNHDTI